MALLTVPYDPYWASKVVGDAMQQRAQMLQAEQRLQAQKEAQASQQAMQALSDQRRAFEFDRRMEFERAKTAADDQRSDERFAWEKAQVEQGNLPFTVPASSPAASAIDALPSAAPATRTPVVQTPALSTNGPDLPATELTLPGELPSPAASVVNAIPGLDEVMAEDAPKGSLALMPGASPDRVPPTKEQAKESASDIVRRELEGLSKLNIPGQPAVVRMKDVRSAIPNIISSAVSAAHRQSGSAAKPRFDADAEATARGWTKKDGAFVDKDGMRWGAGTSGFYTLRGSTEKAAALTTAESEWLGKFGPVVRALNDSMPVLRKAGLDASAAYDSVNDKLGIGPAIEKGLISKHDGDVANHWIDQFQILNKAKDRNGLEPLYQGAISKLQALEKKGAGVQPVGPEISKQPGTGETKWKLDEKTGAKWEIGPDGKLTGKYVSPSK